MQRQIIDYSLTFLFVLLLITGMVRAFIKSNDFSISRTKALHKANREFFTFMLFASIPASILMWIENPQNAASVLCLLFPPLFGWIVFSGSIWLDNKLNRIILRKRIENRQKKSDIET